MALRSIFLNASRGAGVRSLLAPQTWPLFGSRLGSTVASFQRLGVTGATVDRKNISFFGWTSPVSNQCRAIKSSSQPLSRSPLQIELIPCLLDNYAYLLHDPDSNLTAVVDPSEAGPVNERLKQRGLTLTHILCTHHHADHTGGNLALKAEHNAQVVGAAIDKHRIPGITIPVRDSWQFGRHKVQVLDTPGHTRGHCCYYFPASHAVFTGDTLFSLGCGRIIEGTAEEMWDSLLKLMDLPDETLVYCGHEYTKSNSKFALYVEGTMPELQYYFNEVWHRRENGLPTVCLQHTHSLNWGE